jgi:hypothetical protein
MFKKIITIFIVIIIVAGLGYWIYQSTSTPQGITEAEAKSCEIDADCVVFGKDGDCNCGCFNKNYQWEKEGDCFCAAPTSCKCINSKCEGIFDETACAEDGDTFSTVVEGHLDSCCEGLKEWIPIPDTRFSIADVCYEVGLPSESNIGLCIKCGDGVCENHPQYDENPCNCPEDCAGKNKSHFSSIEEFCQSNDWKMSLSKACEEQEPIKGSPICELCAF